jgi:hypothetical protein
MAIHEKMATLGKPWSVTDPNPPKPIAFTREGRTEPELFACGACGLHWAGPDAKKIAVWHCARRGCRYCGADLGRNSRTASTACGACWELRLWEKATKVLETNYDGPLTNGDRFWSDVEDALDWFECEEMEAPDWLWAVDVEPVCVDADHIIDSVASGGLPSDLELEAVDELREAIEKWNAKQGAAIWHPDYKRVVVLRHPQQEGP